jgi:hypothetical protein
MTQYPSSAFALLKLTPYRPGHYNRALEDAISTHKNQWARDWQEKSPLAGGATFATMNPTERVRNTRRLALSSPAHSITTTKIDAYTDNH